MTRTLSELADEAEEAAIKELENKIFLRQNLYALGQGEHGQYRQDGSRLSPGKTVFMGDDPRLPAMPDKPGLLDFVRCRFAVGGQQHLLQSARLARKNGVSGKMILACLLHDLAVSSFVRSDHGYWGAAMIEPYVDEEVAWAIRYHQCVRFFADPENGYEYPELYIKFFGEGYEPEDYIKRDYEYARNHKWYGSALEICKNDHYAFDHGMVLEWDEFEDVLADHFHAPEEGLGNDNTPASHIWRTLRRPSNGL